MGRVKELKVKKQIRSHFSRGRGVQMRKGKTLEVQDMWVEYRQKVQTDTQVLPGCVL